MRSPLCYLASSGGVADVDFVALELSGFSFGLFTEQPAKMRVFCARK